MVEPRTMKTAVGAWLLLGVLIAWVAGCATRSPAPVTEYGKPVDSLIIPPPLGGTDQLPITVPKTAAVSALLQDAKLKVMAGDLEGAAQTLERTLRIEPRNPLLWSELAYVRSQQGKLEQAEQLAVKSNSLAVEDVPLQVHNWRLIAEVRRQLGDSEAVGTAEQHIRELGVR